MILTSKEARTLLEIERKNTTDDRWIEHCISVGDSAGRIAKAFIISTHPITRVTSTKTGSLKKLLIAGDIA